MICWSPVIVLGVWFVLLLLGVSADETRVEFIGSLTVAMGFYIHGTRQKLRRAERARSPRDG